MPRIAWLLRPRRACAVTVAVAGPSCSGKTTLVNYFELRGLGTRFSMDSFYKPTPEIPVFVDDIPAFDHPDAFDLAMLNSAIASARSGIATEIPRYEYYSRRGGRLDGTDTYDPKGAVLVDGILSLHPTLQPSIDLGIFVVRSASRRRAARLRRDVEHCGVSPERCSRVYDRMTVPLTTCHVLPQEDAADIVVVNPG